MTRELKIKAKPYTWPKKDNIPINELAIIIIDMQNDYCSKKCYMDKAGFNVKRLRKPIKTILNVLKEARKKDIEIIYTRHGEENINENEEAITASVKKL